MSRTSQPGVLAMEGEIQHFDKYNFTCKEDIFSPKTGTESMDF